MPEKTVTKTDAVGFRIWIPDFDKWPDAWMGMDEDLVYGKKLLPYFEEFLQWLYEQGIARKTFVQYRDNLWLLGRSIIRQVSNYEEYNDYLLSATTSWTFFCAKTSWTLNLVNVICNRILRPVFCPGRASFSAL
jgi:hypothetical protein